MNPDNLKIYPEKAYPYFPRDVLLKAIKEGHKKKYNRQVSLKFFKSIALETRYFPVVFSLLHEHIAGKPVKPHIRCVVVFDAAGDTFQIDVSKELFEELPVKASKADADGPNYEADEE